VGSDVHTRDEHEVSCPHCKKAFAAPLLAGRRNRGFKCPHCRLFVPLARVSDLPLARDPDA
jgi:tRNA(Ile2) C34 agmatinyltransferase TiaS